MNIHAHLHIQMHYICPCICSHSHTFARIGVVQIGSRIHRRVPTTELRSGPSSRRGSYVSLRGRCVECYHRAPVPASGSGEKKQLSNGKSIPQTTYACDVCRKLLCRDCFHHVYDHRQRGRKYDTVILK